MIKFLRLYSVVVLVLLVLPLWFDQAEAHRVTIFAFGQGEYIVGGTSFSGGKKPVNVEIIVKEASRGKTIFRTRTDNEGNFRFKIPREARQKHLDLLLVVNAGDGHRGEWPLPAAEYLDNPEPDSKPIQSEKTGNEKIEAGLQQEKMSSFKNIEKQQIRRIVEDAVEKKLAPIKYMLAESRDKGPDLRDILGGIGYIFGLAGIVVFFKYKKRED